MGTSIPLLQKAQALVESTKTTKNYFDFDTKVKAIVNNYFTNDSVIGNNKLHELIDEIINQDGHHITKDAPSSEE